MDDQQTPEEREQEPSQEPSSEVPPAGPEAGEDRPQVPSPPGTGGGAEAPPLPPELQAANASQQERTWAMLCHLLALAGIVVPFGNILGPLIMWLVKREESAFVDFHGRQSLWFQVWVAIVGAILAFMTIVLTFLTFCLGLPFALLGGALALGALIYAIVGAVQVSGGKDFEYYWVGPWVRRSQT